VYIGHRASQEQRDSILNALRVKYPKTSAYFADVNIQDYSMVFHEIR